MSDTSLEIQGLRHRTVKANGLTFHVTECGEGDRLALCLHGFPENWISWRYQIPLLAELGWRVWAPDMRGYGGSDKPQSVDDYAIETLLEDVAGLIDASEASEVLLIGHDWGGIIAWYFALRQIRPLSGLVIMNAPHPGASEKAFRRPIQLLRSLYALFFQIPGLPEKWLGARNAKRVGAAFSRMARHREHFPEAILELYQHSALRPGALTGMLNYYRAFLGRGGLDRQRELGYPEIDVRTLFLWGERDTALGRKTSEGAEAFVSNLVLRYIPDASHWVQQDTPETVNEMLGAWLREESVPEAGNAN